jgi:hypothetical protein
MVFGAALIVASTVGLVPVAAQDDVETVKEKKAIVITIENGKMTIRDQDGKERTVELGEHAGPILLEQLLHNAQDGATRDALKTLIVDADGNRQAVELDGGTALMLKREGLLTLGGDGGARSFFVQDEPGQEQAQAELEALAASKYMIGIDAQPVPDAVRAHVNLDEGVGLIVNQLHEGTPAAESDLQQFDILVRAGDEPLRNLAGLIGAVQEAGENDTALELVVLRRGDDMRIEVKPVERKSVELKLGEMELDLDAWRALRGEGLRLEHLQPGVIEALEGEGINKETVEHLKRMAEEFRAEAEALRERAAAEAQSRLGDQSAAMTEELKAQLAELRSEIERLRSELRGGRDDDDDDDN